MSPEPGADTALEVMVMIRDDIRNDVVYPFSFTDMGTAYGFVQHEMQRGLDPNHVLLYWAAPVQLAITADGEIGLFPKAPPTAVDHDTVEFTHAAATQPVAETSEPGDFMQSLSVSVAAAEPFVSTEDDPIEALFASVDERVAEPVAEITRFEEEIGEFVGGGDEAILEETAEASAEAEMIEETFEDACEVEVDAALVDVEVVAADVAEDAPLEEQMSEVMTDDATAEDTTEDWNETADETPGTFVAADAVEESMEPVAAISSQQWVSDGPIGTEFPAGRAYAKGEAHLNDFSEQLQRVLRVRRWEESTEPFRGFQSPPGRF
jgi:hypothetical protein